MPVTFLEESMAVLTRTPAALDALLCGLPEPWVRATEGPGTWSPCQVVGHLIHADRTDWLPRLGMILDHGTTREFEPFDREAQRSETRPLAVLLDEFHDIRAECLDRLRRLDLQPRQLESKGLHPAFGEVTARQLLATWTAHDLGHLVQIARVMARRYREDVGPWAEYLSVLKPQ